MSAKLRVKTKILATLGPASVEPDRISAMIAAGMNAVRINFSHGKHELHEKVIANVRRESERYGTPIALVGDLCGPKIRCGRIDESDNLLAEGDRVTIVREPADGTAHRFGTNRPEVVDEVQVGHRVLIDDGNLRLQVVAKQQDQLECMVEVGGELSDNKGINLPDSDIDVPALTDRDRDDLRFALQHELDYIALSFVRSAADLVQLRDALRDANSDMQVVAKIETPQAVARMEEIVPLTDVVLVARGDLGVEMDVARVPLIQKDLVRCSRRHGKPVIIATQMLQSMVDQPVPTRAEVSDVANAILDGADVVMLSAETAVGKHPIEAVRTMRRIAVETEPYRQGRSREDVAAIKNVTDGGSRIAAAVARSTALVAHDLDAKVICVRARMGESIRMVSKHRPQMPVIGLAPNETIRRRLALYYGVEPVLFDGDIHEPEVLRELDRFLIESNYAANGDLAVMEAGAPPRMRPNARGIIIHHVQA